jgi:HEAT repeat protein
VLYALGKMGESAKSAIPQIMPLLQDPDLDVRESAVSALSSLKHQP